MSTTESRSFVGSLPGWLQSYPGREYVEAISLTFDAFVASLDDVRQGLVSVEPPLDAVPEFARDRGLFRGFFEPASAFMTRSSLYRQFWKVAARPSMMLYLIAQIWGPNPPKMRIVRNFGWVAPPHVAKSRWTTREIDGTFSEHVSDPANFDWDGQNLPHRAFLIIYADVLATEIDGTYNDGSSLYGESGVRFDGTRDKKTAGTNAFHEYVQRTRACLDAMKPASVFVPNIIIAFDPASFDPTAAPGSPGMPDGTWGRDMKLVAGVTVPSRLQTARYWKGA